jgi:pyruvate dehydrogenase E1 component
VLEAQELLTSQWGVQADVWSVTSWTELRRDALSADRARLRGEERVPYVTAALSGAPGPVLAVSDWMRQVPDQISQWVEQDYTSLGTDGFGLSDTRDAVRRYFHVDAESIVVAALDQLARAGAIAPETVVQARDRYGRQG